MTGGKETRKDWLDYWKGLEKRKGINGKTPRYTEDLISWLFRELHGDETYKSLAGWKRKGKRKGNSKPENDRLAIGIRPMKTDGKISYVAFSLFPDKDGQLLFLLYAVNAQKSEAAKDESKLREWVENRKLPSALSECIFPGRERVGREGDLGLTNPYSRYAKIAIRGFDGTNFQLVRKTSEGKPDEGKPAKVPASAVRKLLIDQIRNRPSVGKRRVR